MTQIVTLTEKTLETSLSVCSLSLPFHETMQHIYGSYTLWPSLRLLMGNLKYCREMEIFQFRKKPSQVHAVLSELDLRALALSGLLGISGS